MGEITKRFSEGARRMITAGMLCAKELGHTYVGSEHLLLGLLKEEKCVCARLLNERGVTYDSARNKLINIAGMGCKALLSSDDMTPVCRRIILRANLLANSESSVSVGIEHLLFSLLREDCVAVRIITELGGDAEELREVVGELFFENQREVPFSECKQPDSAVKNAVSTPILDANSLNLTEKARLGKIDPVIGREEEEARMIAILLRRSKNNPCLVGEAGVGKTAVVESLALRIASGNVPEELKNKRIMSLELSTVVAGTKYRGEFEEKIRNIVEEVRAAGDVILFIDEIHTIVGAGGAEGAIDASNILKPALARGEIKLIGATTLKEFRESIERDKALERRFQSVAVEEPSEAQCIEMLCGIRKKYESYHNITITDEAVSSAVRLSARYIPERYLPDKAIDLMDEASAVLKLCRSGRKKPILTEAEIALAAERRTGIPISVLNSDEKQRLLNLESELKKQVIGQDEAINCLCGAVRRARMGLHTECRPNASFLFIGKAGVGKTQCAKALAETVFNGENSFIRFDMSEFSEPHSVSKLVGSPPGYVGFGEGGVLTEKVRRNPYSLVLFDEVEKAHPDVRALLLQILDEGKLTDSSGLTVNFGNTVVIMTANQSGMGNTVGFGSDNYENVQREAKKLVSSELADRVDEVIIFKTLSPSELKEIARARVEEFCARLSEKGISAEISEDFFEGVMKTARDYGARIVSRTALRLAEEAVSDLLLQGNPQKDEVAVIFVENGRGVAKIKQNIY